MSGHSVGAQDKWHESEASRAFDNALLEKSDLACFVVDLVCFIST